MPLHQPRQPVDLNHPMVQTSAATWTWGQVAEMVSTFQDILVSLRGQRVGLPFHADGTGLATLSALQQLDCNIFLLPLDATQDYLNAVAEQFQLSAIVTAPSETTQHPIIQSYPANKSTASCDPGITILTSGTTGTPKAARHTLQSLTKPTRVHPSFLQTSWLLCYRPNLYAGFR